MQLGTKAEEKREVSQEQEEGPRELNIPPSYVLGGQSQQTVHAIQPSRLGEEADGIPAQLGLLKCQRLQEMWGSNLGKALFTDPRKG